MKKLFRVFLILFFIGCCVFSVACDKKQIKSFEATSNTPMSGFLGKCVADTDTFDINNVRLKFYYGGLYDSGIENALAQGLSIPSFDLYFNSLTDNCDWNTAIEYKIKHVDENFVSEKYRITGENYYNEELVIPSELFVQSSGLICFRIAGTYNHKNSDDTYDGILGIFIHYSKIDNNTILITPAK